MKILKPREIFDLLKESYTRWNDQNPFQLSAALSYYTIFSLPALLITIIAVAGFIFGKEAVSGEIYRQMSGLIGREGALQVQEMVANAAKNDNSILAIAISIGTIIFSATTVFAQLQNNLNLIWGVKAKPKRAWLKYILDRVFSFGMIAVIGFLLLISLVVSSLLAAFYTWMNTHFSEIGTVLINIFNNLISLGLYTLMFAFLYKVLPDVQIKWRDVWIGSLFTAMLFSIGKFAIGFYLGTSDPGSTYGAAGSIIVILLWVSYSSLIVFFGANFTAVFAERYGDKLRPATYAVPLSECEIPQNKAPLAKAENIKS